MMVNNTFSEIQNLGRLIREMRQSRGVSANDLVQVTGLSHSVISKFERGQTDIQFSSMIKILSAMSLTLEDLCHASMFTEFVVNEMAEKAYECQNSPAILETILNELNRRAILLRQEQVFKRILETRVHANQPLSHDVNDYFDNLTEFWTFDAYLALLAEPFLSQRLHLRIAKVVVGCQGQLPKIINIAYDTFVQ